MSMTWNQFLAAVVAARRPAPRRDEGDGAETPHTEDEFRRLAAIQANARAADTARPRRRRTSRFCDENRDQGEGERLLPEAAIRRALWFYSAIPPRQRTVTIAYLAGTANLSRMHVYRIRNGHHLTTRTHAALSGAITALETPHDTLPTSPPQRWPVAPYEKTAADTKVDQRLVGIGRRGVVFNICHGR
jgi:hypothetical protein